jgi:hypothetical protein
LQNYLKNSRKLPLILHEAKYISLWLYELSNACPPTAPCTYSGNLLQSVYHALLYINVLLLLLFYYCWCYYTSPPPDHLAQVRQRAEIYIYKTPSVKSKEGRVMNILQKEKKVREGGGQRAESDRTKMNNFLCPWFACIKTLWQNFRSFLSKDFHGFFCLHYNNNSHLFNDYYTGIIFLLLI